MVVRYTEPYLITHNPPHGWEVDIYVPEHGAYRFVERFVGEDGEERAKQYVKKRTITKFPAGTRRVRGKFS